MVRGDDNDNGEDTPRWMSDSAAVPDRPAVVRGLPDHEIERAILVLSRGTVLDDNIWLPLLIAEAKLRGLPVTRSN